jgi:phosphoglycolate phosphatase
MHTIGGVVFDLDGTLIDSRSDIGACANYALARAGFPQRVEQEIAGFVGDGATLLMARSAGLTPDDALVPELVRAFVDHYAAHPVVETTLMPGAAAALDALAGLALAVCTNKPRAVTTAILDELGILTCFSAIVAGDDGFAPKPSPAPLFAIAERVAIAPAHLVMVGDGPQDIACGRAAGARSVGVRGPFVAFERLDAAEPDAIVDSLVELPELLRAWMRRG